MPEIAEVRTVAKTLNKQLANQTIKDINIIYNNIIDGSIDEFKDILIGKKINKVMNYGKYLFFDLGDKTLISHLRMEGKYFIKNNEEVIEKHEHVIFIFADFSLRYHDTRKFGRMKVVDTKDLFNTKEISKLGIEPDDERLTKTYLYEKIHKKNIPIKTLLLDQSIINGLGNIYADEVLYASSINPLKKGSEITLDECEQIRKSAKDIISLATKLGGTTIRSYTSSLGVKGNYQDHLKIHTKKQCLRCHENVEKIRVGGRGTYYCKNCQK